MLHKILVCLTLLAVSVVVGAEEVQINPDHPDEYVVQKGDTLWDIAGRFLTEPWRWPEIWQVNPQIANPHLIYPGDVVSLTYYGDRPVLTVDRGGRAVRRDGRTVKLSPQVRYLDDEDAIPSIPIEAIREFLTRPLVVTEDQYQSWPYIVSSYDQHLVNGPGNEIYVRGLEESEQRRYTIYRQGPAYISNGEVLGYEAIYVGEAVVREFGDPATAIITSAEREALNGDRLIPQSETDINSDFIPRSPEEEVSGSIISAIDVLSEIGQYQVVVLDLGESDGISVGNVLGVYQKGDVIVDRIRKKGDAEPVAGYGTNPISNFVGDVVKTKQDFDDTDLVGYLGRPRAAGEEVRLPDKYTGVIMVFRTFDRVSYALVMEAQGPMHLDDTVKNL